MSNFEHGNKSKKKILANQLKLNIGKQLFILKIRLGALLMIHNKSINKDFYEAL